MRHHRLFFYLITLAVVGWLLGSSWAARPDTTPPPLSDTQYTAEVLSLQQALSAVSIRDLPTATHQFPELRSVRWKEASNALVAAERQWEWTDDERAFDQLLRQAVGKLAGIPPALDPFGLQTVYLDDRALWVAIADTLELRQKGLSGLAQLGPLDGMLFIFGRDSNARFWMKDTLLPLDIAFFTHTGDLVDTFFMDLCQEEPCPTYGPGAPYRYALETPAGTLQQPTPGGRLRL